jgi:hypothetical protein
VAPRHLGNPTAPAIQRPRQSSARNRAATCSVSLGNIRFGMAERWLKNSQVVKTTFAGNPAAGGSFVFSQQNPDSDLILLPSQMFNQGSLKIP